MVLMIPSTDMPIHFIISPCHLNHRFIIRFHKTTSNLERIQSKLNVLNLSGIEMFFVLVGFCCLHNKISVFHKIQL